MFNLWGKWKVSQSGCHACLTAWLPDLLFVRLTSCSIATYTNVAITRREEANRVYRRYGGWRTSGGYGETSLVIVARRKEFKKLLCEYICLNFVFVFCSPLGVELSSLFSFSFFSFPFSSSSLQLHPLLSNAAVVNKFDLKRSMSNNYVYSWLRWKTLSFFKLERDWKWWGR